MEYAFKPTTHGRALIAACMALEAPLKITRTAVGSGRVSQEADLADVHQLLQYEAEGAMGDRRHEENRLYLTVQYCNRNNPEGRTFQLAEFIIYAEHPETGEETDLLYATLGDYVQAVPPYSPSFPAAVWNFPLTLVISGEIEVIVNAPAGLVTSDDLLTLLAQHNADPQAHGNGRHVIATRERGAGKPDYGLLDNGGAVALQVGPYTGAAEVAAVVSGQEYDALNLRTSAQDAPSGTLILKRLEDDA